MIKTFLLFNIILLGYAELVQQGAKFTDSYIPSTYANFTSLEDAVLAYKNVLVKEPNFLIEIGKIFLKFQQAEKFGLALLHKHFPLKDDEILVESVNKQFAVTMPWKIDGKILKHKIINKLTLFVHHFQEILIL